MAASVPPPCPSLEQLAHNSCLVFPVLPELASPPALVESLAAVLRQLVLVDFRDISPYQGFSADDCSLAHLSWSRGSIRLSWLDSREELTLLCPHGRPSIVVGLLHCPSIPATSSLAEAFQGFCAFVQQALGPSVESVVVCALDIGDQHLVEEALPALLQRGLEIFPPGAQTLDSGERAVDFHMRVVMSNACSRLVRQYEDLVREADLAAKQLQTVAVQRPGAIGILPASPVAPAPSAPSCRHPETCRLFAGAASFPGDQAPILTSVTGGSTQARRASKNLAARLCVWSAKHCLLAGSPLDALARFEAAVGLCRAVEDAVWEALAHEGMAAARWVAHADGWAGEAERPDKAVRQDLDTALALYARHTSHAAVRRLHSEAGLRAAAATLQAGDLAGALDLVAQTRRVQALHPAFAWYMEREASLWECGPRPMLGVAALCMAEAAERLAEGEDFRGALRVLERAAPLVGVAARPPAPRGGAAAKPWLAVRLLQRVLFVARQLGSSAPEGLFCFYASQLLLFLGDRSSSGGGGDDDLAALRLLREMAERQPGAGTCVQVGALFRSGAARVAGARPLPLDTSPPRVLGAAAAAAAAAEASVFIFSPFAANASAPSSSAAAVSASAASTVLWVECEPAMVEVVLSNPFDAEVRAELLMEGAEAVTVALPARTAALPVRLGPVAVRSGLEAVQLLLRVLGCEFSLAVAAPGVLRGLPLLERTPSGVRNVGARAAVLALPGGGRAVLEAGEEAALQDASDLAYTDADGQVERVLLAEDPVIVGCRVTRADTTDALDGAWACCQVSLRLPTLEAVAVALDSGSKGLVESAWTPGAVATEHGVLLYGPEDVAELKQRLAVWSGERRAIWAPAAKVAATSTAPPAWLASVEVEVAPEDVRPLEFVRCAATGVPHDARCEFVVFHEVGERLVAVDADADSLVWCGRSAAAGGGGRVVAGVAVAPQGVYVVGCRVSDARASWWVRFVRVGVRL